MTRRGRNQPKSESGLFPRKLIPLLEKPQGTKTEGQRETEDRREEEKGNSESRKEIKETEQPNTLYRLCCLDPNSSKLNAKRYF